MRRCRSCDGILGVDCFNESECEYIGHMQEAQKQNDTQMQIHHLKEETVLAAAALDKLATDIVNQLDDYARDYNSYEYGLPTHDSHLEQQIEIVKRLISSCH